MKTRDFKNLQTSICGREFDLFKTIFCLAECLQTNESEHRSYCPRCEKNDCVQFYQDNRKFCCEKCGYKNELIQWVIDVQRVSQLKAYDIIEEAAGLCIDGKQDDEKITDSTSTTIATVIPVALDEETPVSKTDIIDTVSEQKDDNATGGYCSHLDVERQTQMIPLKHIKLSGDYHFRVQDDQDTIENYADILRQYCDDLTKDQSATYPFQAIVVLHENDDAVYYQAVRLISLAI